MTDTRITRAFPHLPKPLARVALLGETLELAREMKAARLEIEEADAEEAVELTKRFGLSKEIETAERTATETVVDILAKVSESDLEEGRDKELLSPEDFREALAAKRTMSLKREASPDREHQAEG